MGGFPSCRGNKGLVRAVEFSDLGFIVPEDIRFLNQNDINMGVISKCEC